MNSLEALEELKRIFNNHMDIMKSYFSTFVKEIFDIVEKDLKAFEIIKEHYVRLDLIHICKTVEEYNNYIYNDRDSLYNGVEKITKDQFDLLKECLK